MGKQLKYNCDDCGKDEYNFYSDGLLICSGCGQFKQIPAIDTLTKEAKEYKAKWLQACDAIIEVGNNNQRLREETIDECIAVQKTTCGCNCCRLISSKMQALKEGGE